MAAEDDLRKLLERMVRDAEIDDDSLLSASDSRSVTEEIASLKRGLLSRGEIGQAQGIVMERHKVTADVAFQILTRLSQHTNRKLVDICRELVATGEIPDDPKA